MRNIVISLAAVAALSTIAAPAAAQRSAIVAAPQGGDDAGTAVSTQRPRARASTDGGRLICARVSQAASHITRRVCRTQQEWQARGEDEIADSR